VRLKRTDRSVLGQLRTLFNIGTIRDLTDGQLLERFATDNGEVAELAFAALVERHEAMVWRVCLAIVRDRHEAEDAFQATFLVLVRRARSLWVRDSLGPWLHQVACRTASCLRATVNRRRRHEQRYASRDAACSLATTMPRDSDLDAAIHDEVNRLPEKYRAPIVLCDLEGRTHQEAARFLGWPIGTVKSRQSHGRGLIRKRLVRRGMGLGVAGAIVELFRQNAVAATPTEVSLRAVRGAMQQTGRLLTGLKVSANALTLAQGALQAMLWAKLRFIVAGAVTGIACVSASVYVLGSQEPTDAQRGNGPTSPGAQTPTARTSKKTAEQAATSTSQAALRVQQLATRRAKARFEIARQTSELAKIAVEEYDELIFPGDLATVEGEITLAKSDLSRSEDRVEWAKRMFEKKYISQSVKVSEELSLKKAQFAIEQAKSKKLVLVEYTKGKTINELKSEVEKASVNELEKKAIWELEKGKEMKLERELNSKRN
jgi:HlyD family secretion protein